LEYLLEQVELEPSQEIAQEILLDQQRMLQWGWHYTCN
jgi:hypothetical protein